MGFLQDLCVRYNKTKKSLHNKVRIIQGFPRVLTKRMTFAGDLKQLELVRSAGEEKGPARWRGCPAQERVSCEVVSAVAMAQTL